jgi:hypothetical protein
MDLTIPVAVMSVTTNKPVYNEHVCVDFWE